MESTAFDPATQATDMGLPPMPTAAELLQWRWQRLTDEDPLYVKNNVSQNQRRRAGDICLQVVNRHGKVDPVKVENTWAPQDLTQQGIIADIKGNRDFKSFVDRGILAVLHPVVAQHELARPATQAELRRLAERRSDRLAGRDATDDRMAAAGRSQDPGALQLVHGRIPEESARPNIGMEVVERYQRREITVDACVSMLHNIRSMLSPHDIVQLKEFAGLPQGISEAIVLLDVGV